MPENKSPEELRTIVESERRLREAERIAKIGSWDLDLVNNELVWSDEIYRIFDAVPQSFGATYEAFLSFIHPDDRDFVDETFKKSLENKEPYGPITHRLVMKSGCVKFVEERGFTVYNEDGVPVRSNGTCQDITERVVGEKTKAQLKEKEVLLKEIYHRVKNNLQLISSLLNLQASRIDDDEIKSIFEVNQKRISAIALVHSQLCQSDNLASVQANEFITSLIENYKVSSIDGLKDIEFILNLSNASISMDKAVPFGLIINEVINNSVKHAFSDQSGKIYINLSKKIDHWDLVISDNGKGVESLENIEKTTTFGMEIVRSLTDQLDGSFKIDGAPNEGMKFSFVFPE